MLERLIFKRLRAALFTGLFFIFGAVVQAHADVTLEVDRQRIVEGETVTLIFKADDAQQNLDADFSRLEEDFEILDRRSESQISIVNGRQTAVVRLLLTVEPRRAGELIIPAISFSSNSTKPQNLVVESAPEPEPGSMPPVFIEVELTPSDGPYYVHAQFGMVVRVFYQQNLTEAAITSPEPAPASVRLLQETPYQAERGGERYRVLERVYAIFPERSGALTIPAMQLTGRLVERRSSGAWQPSLRGRRVQVESDSMELQVEPKPDAFAGQDWQPARDFRLTQQISAADALRVGEPVTRTVIIDVVGLEENMIVEPAWPEVNDVRIYPDQPQGITRDDGSWVLGHKEFRYAVVPEKEGELVLPELVVEWWDTVNDRPNKAVLPAHTLQVMPSQLVPTPSAPSVSTAESETTPVAGTGNSGAWEPGRFRLNTMLVLAAAWLASLYGAWWLGGGRRKPRSVAERGERPEAEAEWLAGLESACRRNDRREARRMLQGWLRAFGPTASGSLLEFAAGHADEDLGQGVTALDTDGFRRDDQATWDGRSFWRAFKGWLELRARDERKRSVSVTDLYAPENRSN